MTKVGISTRSVDNPNPILHLPSQDSLGDWHTLCNGGRVVVQEYDDVTGRPCRECMKKGLGHVPFPPDWALR